jgi:hypothetical protein
MCTLRFEMIISYTKFMCIFLGFVLLLPFFFTTIKTAGAIFCFRPGLRQPRILRSPACLWRARKKKRKKKSLSVMSVNGRTKDHPPAVFECWRRPFIRRRNQDHRQHIDRPAIMPFQTPPALTEVRKKISQIYFGRWLWRSRAKLVAVDLQERVTVFRSNLTENRIQTK